MYDSNVSGFGDFDPEDAYDVNDRPNDRLDVLHKVVAALEASPPDDVRRGFRIVDALRLLDGIRHHRSEVAVLRARLEAL
jgi:hypothetical protein